MSKQLFDALRLKGCFEFGQVISGDLVREILGIEYPVLGTRKEFSELALAEIGAIDYVRNILLGQGKYLSCEKGDYRILLPSENQRQVAIYMSHADRKLKRALKLSRNSPTTDQHQTDNTNTRIMFKRESLRDRMVIKREPDRPSAH